jgi:hypothetical protein
MYTTTLKAAVLAAAALFSSTAAAAATSTSSSSSSVVTVDPLVIKGQHFFYKTNGTEFFIKGVAYQPDADANGTSTSTTFTDPLADETTCARDLPYLVGLKTNTIRVYAIDPTKNHDACMSMLAGAGIYVVNDLSSPTESINRDDPQWSTDLYTRYTSVIDVMQAYTNTLGFFAGNEVSNNNTNTQASPFVKAAIRDMKAYIATKGYRTIPVGYATSDNADIRGPLADYFNCGDSSESIDFWGYNIYSWCGSDSSFTISGYSDRTEEFANYSVPAFFAEYGCNVPSPRVFDETTALFSSEMTGVWSGGIVYMYFETTNNYGLVNVSGNTVSELTDYKNLQSKIKAVSPSQTNSASYTPTNTAARSCPTLGADWNASSTLPPTPNEELCECMVDSLSCVVSPSVAVKSYGALFGYLYGVMSLPGILSDGTTGTYGAYSMCNSTQQLSWAMNAYYLAQDSASSSCDFNGDATLVNPAALGSTCSSLVNEAGGASGTGTVTSQPTGTGGSSGTTSKSAAGQYSPQRFDFGSIKIATAVLGAALTGVGILFM